MPKKNRNKKGDKKGDNIQGDEQTGREFRVVSPVLVTPTSWTPSRAALRAMERVYGKDWRELTYHSVQNDPG